LNDGLKLKNKFSGTVFGILIVCFREFAFLF